MDRYSIEKRDREVVEKFRAAVESRERRKKNNRTRLAGMLLFMVCAGLILLYKNFSFSPEAEKPEIHKSNSTAVTRERPVQLAPSRETAAVPDKSQSVGHVAAAPGTDDSVPATERPVAPEARGVPVLAAKKEAAESIPVFTPRVKATDKNGSADVFKQASPNTGIRIAEMVTCQGVQNRQPVDRKNVFSIKEGAKPYVWMDVRSQNTPYTLRHFYYLNDRRYCVVPLEIRYPRMRTWSTITLQYPTQTGKWRVDVVTRQEDVIARVDFLVVP